MKAVWGMGDGEGMVIIDTLRYEKGYTKGFTEFEPKDENDVFKLS